MKSKNKKGRKPNKSFREKFTHKLIESQIGDVNIGIASDDSCSWVELVVKDKQLCFTFDGKGDKLLKVGLFKDRVEVVGQVRIWDASKGKSFMLNED